VTDDFDPDLNAEDFDDDGLEAFELEQKPLDDNELKSLVLQLVELRGRKDETDKVAKAAKKEFEDFQRELYERIQNSPVKGSRTVDIGGDHGKVMITPKATKYGRILDRTQAVDYLKERKLDAEFIKDDFRMARVHEIVREHIEQKKPLPPGFDYYTKEYFQITFKD
jgi:hypothetical protein